MKPNRTLHPISGGTGEIDALIAQAKVNDDLLDSITGFLTGVGVTLATAAQNATDLASLKVSVNQVASDLKSKDDIAAAALVSATPAAKPSVTPPGPVPITPPLGG